jgi:hypothetical protein
MRKTKRNLLEEAEKNVSLAYDILRVHEKQWEEMWQSAANPFAAYEEHKKQKPHRVALINALLEAKDTYNKLRERA